MTDTHASRRNFLATAATSVVAANLVAGSAAKEVLPEPRQASGVKVGEVTATTAIVWTRLTAAATRNNDGQPVEGRVTRDDIGQVTVPIAELHGACPGATGKVRVRYGTREDLSDAQTTDWIDVTAKSDFSHQFTLRELKPATLYHYATETTDATEATPHGSVRGRFETAPTADAPSQLQFCVLTCQGYYDRDHQDGHPIYPAILALKPQFVVLAGDNVYYDNDKPRAVNIELARYHWQRMFSLPRQVELLRSAGSYFTKDDHDTLDNDSWPGNRMGMLKFAEGQEVFRQQVPLGKPAYRTFRWGRDLQIWLTDSRDYRSPNKMPDGPEKTIWGPEQKAWVKRTLQESDATWKVLISPTPIVGPDRGKKNDNHANTGFQHEGDEIRQWFAANTPDNFFVVCGDRHWQYHSVHPETSVQEFSVGAASDSHAGGSPGFHKTYHRFHRVKGGFLSITLAQEGSRSTITCQHRDVTGKVVYEWQKARSVTT